MSTSEDALVLVTGASGFIAAHIVKLLQEQGYRVRGTVRNVNDEKKVGPLRRLAESPKHDLMLAEADLLNESSWPSAVKDCDYVIHTASPFPIEPPSDDNLLIKPAVDGTLNVLRACAQEGSKVKRVVLTSSVVSIYGNTYVPGKIYTEDDWPDINRVSGYPKSKVLAEKAAWDFVEERKKNNELCFELSVINPSFVMGPMLTDIPSASCDAIKKLFKREIPLLPDVSFPVCDVRDVALAHVRAMTKPECVSKRHIITSYTENSSFQSWAFILDAEFKSKNYRIPTHLAPSWLIRFGSYFDRNLRQVVPFLGIKCGMDNSRLLNVLENSTDRVETNSC